MAKDYINGMEDYLKLAGTPPTVYDNGRKFGVHGRTSLDQYYDVTIMGENPLYDPSSFGETEKGLLGKIQDAAERSAQKVKDGFGTKAGVIIVDELTYVTPSDPSVEVVVVYKERKGFI